MKKRFFFIWLFVILLAFPLHAQLKMSGYLSFEFLKGQSQSPFAEGSFQNARAGLLFSREKEEKFNYILELRFKDEARIEIEQAWAGFNPSPAFQLKLGFFLVPFGKYNQSNRPHETGFIRFPLHLENIYPPSWRDLGILVQGKVGVFLYSAYFGNGLAEGENLKASQQFADNNSDKGKGGRVSFLVGKSAELGLSYYRGEYDEANERSLELQGMDFTWTAENLQIFAEYGKAKAENPEPFTDGKAEGYFVQMTFKSGMLWIVAGYQRSRYKDPFHGPAFVKPLSPGGGIFEEKSRWTAGFVYFVSENILLKAEYDFNREPGQSLKDNLFSAQVALHF